MPLTGIPAVQTLVPAVFVVGLLGVLAVVAPGPLVTVRAVDPMTGRVVMDTPHDINSAGDDQKFAPGSFDADQFVDSIWPDKILPWSQQHAVDFDQISRAMKTDRELAETQYGVLSGGDTYNFLVSGKAHVASVDTATPVGVIKLSDPSGENRDIGLYAGPLVFGTALRDVFPFLKLNDFTNQMQYASVAKSLNAKALKRAYKNIDPEALAGKTVAFTGAFAESADGAIQIVPITIELNP